MDVSAELASKVLEHLNREDFLPVKPRVLAKLLELQEEEYTELRRVIKYLSHKGQLAYGSNHMIMRPGQAAAAADTLTGTFRRAYAGFGFVRPHQPDLTNGEDVFIPIGKTADALDGDTVQVQLRTRRFGNGTEARVVKVLERKRRQFTGTFALKGEVPQVYLDGTPYEQPISVGDVRGLPVNVNDKVVVELVKFPDANGFGGEGVLLEVLGSSNNPAVDTLSVMRQFNLSEDFPEAVTDQARQQADQFSDTQVPADRKDLTDLLTITIDPADARDFDDAISLHKNEAGHWQLYVHIADVAHFVPQGSSLDTEARRRATSVYLPDRVVPMLPEIISNHLASLQPERIRLTKTVCIEMAEDGMLIASEVINSAIRSDRRLNYEQVDQFLAAPETFVELWGQPTCELLTNMHRLAMQIRRRRVERGSLEMDLPEVKVDLDRGGKVSGAHLVIHTESHQIIEEFMLAANQAVATWLDDLGLPFLHRIHPAPERRKMIRLSRFVTDLGLSGEAVDNRRAIQRLLKLTKGTQLEFAVQFAVLKAMSKAVYGPQVEPHFALDMDHYCHFTSPIRRYPDLTVHRLVQRLLDGEKTPNEAMSVLVPLGHHCSDQEQQAEQAERELVKLKLLHYLQKRIGETMQAVITVVNQDGILARGIELPAEGFIPVANLPHDRYSFERRGQMLIGFRAGNDFRLGDLLTVKVEKVDLRARELFYSIIKNQSSVERLSSRAERPPGSTYSPKHFKSKKKQLKKKKRRR